MDRRFFLSAVAALIAPGAHAHTPYGQWKVMRQRFLLLHSTRTDPRSDELAEKLVAILRRVLPQAGAMVARSPDEQQVASLMTTGQAVLAVMRSEDARSLFLKQGAFGEYEGAQLRLLARVEDRVLVTVESFPAEHSWLVTSALVENPETLSIRVPEAIHGEVPVHAGAAAFRRGEAVK